MTLEKLQTLPLGTRVVWNREGNCLGDSGQIKSCRIGGKLHRYIAWDDGDTLLHPKQGWRGIGLARLRWVKKVS